MNIDDLEAEFREVAKHLDAEAREGLENAIFHYRMICRVDVNNLSPAERDEHERRVVEDFRRLESLLKQLKARNN